MNAQEQAIAADLQHARRIRAEADQLSATKLADKFDLRQPGEDDEKAGKRVRNIIYNRNQHEDRDLIWDCWEERQRLRKELGEYTYGAIARRYRVRETRVQSVANMLAKNNEFQWEGVA